MNRHSEVFDGVGGRPSAKTKVVDKTSVNAATMKMKVRMEIPTQLAIKKLESFASKHFQRVGGYFRSAQDAAHPFSPAFLKLFHVPLQLRDRIQASAPALELDCNEVFSRVLRKDVYAPAFYVALALQGRQPRLYQVQVLHEDSRQLLFASEQLEFGVVVHFERIAEINALEVHFNQFVHGLCPLGFYDEIAAFLR